MQCLLYTFVSISQKPKKGIITGLIHPICLQLAFNQNITEVRIICVCINLAQGRA